MALPGDGGAAGQGGGLSSPCTFSFETKPQSSQAALLGCVWEVCDLTSMRKRLELRDRKNKQFSPGRGRGSSVSSSQAWWVLCPSRCSRENLRGVWWRKVGMWRLLEGSELSSAWVRAGHQLRGWCRAKPSWASVTQQHQNLWGMSCSSSGCQTDRQTVVASLSVPLSARHCV